MNREFEFVVTVVCTGGVQGRGDHHALPLRRFGYRPNTQQAIGFLEWLELISTFDGPEPVMQTPFGEARRLWKLGANDGPHDRPPMTWQTRYRFDCPECGTVPITGERMEAAFDEVRTRGQRFLPLRVVAM